MLHSILAIIFLGGPNPITFSDEATDRIVALMLKSNSKLSKQCQARLREGAHLIVNVSRLFQDMHLNVELLSLYESERTKVKLGRTESSRFFSSSRKLLVCGLYIYQPTLIFPSAGGQRICGDWFAERTAVGTCRRSSSVVQTPTARWASRSTSEGMARLCPEQRMRSRSCGTIEFR